MTRMAVLHGKTFLSPDDGVHWFPLEQIAGAWLFDECMAIGHVEAHDGLCERCRQRCEEAGE